MICILDTALYWSHCVRCYVELCIYVSYSSNVSNYLADVYYFASPSSKECLDDIILIYVC